jgi:hypothetical protein
MIHNGPLLGPVNTKMAPTHWPLEIWANLKSSGEMDHVWPPKEIATLTVVEQATRTQKTVICQHTTSLADMWATHSRNSTHRNYQYPPQNSG